MDVSSLPCSLESYSFANPLPCYNVLHTRGDSRRSHPRLLIEMVWGGLAPVDGRPQPVPTHIVSAST